MLTFKSLNDDGDLVEWTFSSAEELLQQYWSDECDIPASDDVVTDVVLDDKKLNVSIFMQLITLAEQKYWKDKEFRNGFWVSYLIRDNGVVKCIQCTDAAVSYDAALNVIENARAKFDVISAWIDRFQGDSNKKVTAYHECYVGFIDNSRKDSTRLLKPF